VAAIKLTADVFKKQLDDAGTAATSAADYVVKIGQLTVDDLVKSKFKAGCPLTTIALETAPDNEALSAACKTGFDLWMKTIEGHLERLTGKPSHDEAELILSALEGALAIARTRKNASIILTTSKSLAALHT
ncbi:MAG: hypothetical protein JKY60_17900, partial [Kordiimonadaceae bacterium]|nr:hypothetical protein [Kordiimonadaceae bacterium]